MNIDEIAKKVCDDLFECGCEPGSPVNRIQFLGGSWVKKTEVAQGGFGRKPLEVFLAESLRKHLNNQRG